MTIVYDGDCPFCNNYVHLMALRKAVGTVELIDARTADPTAKDLAERGYDLNEGMVAIYGEKVYYGSDAVILISSMTNAQGWIARLVARVLQSPARAKFLYPYMKTGRRITLRILGKPLI